MARRRARSNTPLDQKQQELARLEEDLRRQMDDLQRLIEEAPRVAEERTRRDRELLVATRQRRSQPPRRLDGAAGQALRRIRPAKPSSTLAPQAAQRRPFALRGPCDRTLHCDRLDRHPSAFLSGFWRPMATNRTRSPRIGPIAAAMAATFQASPLAANCASRRRTMISVTNAARAQMHAPIARVADVPT